MNSKTNPAIIFGRIIAVLAAIAGAVYTMGVVVPELINFGGDLGILGAALIAIVYLAVAIFGLWWVWQGGFGGGGKLMLALVLLTTATGCWHRVQSGYRAVKVNVYGDDRGVDTVTVLAPGKYWDGIRVEFYNVPVFDQRANFAANTAAEGEEDHEDLSLTFQNAQGTKINVDAAIGFRIPKESVGELFDRFRGDIVQELKRIMRNEFRDALGSYMATNNLSMEDMFGKGRDPMMKSVSDRMKAKGVELDIEVTDVQLTSDFRVPEDIRKAIDAKVKRIQEAEEREYQLRERVAQAAIDSVDLAAKKRQIVGTAEAEAKANEIRSKSLTPQVLEMERIKKWDGQTHVVTHPYGIVEAGKSKN